MKLAQSNEERLEILLKLKEIESNALRDELEILKKTTKFTRQYKERNRSEIFNS